jgi:hypothetical protein
MVANRRDRAAEQEEDRAAHQRRWEPRIET